MRNGRNFPNLSQRDAMQILAATQYPITMQIKSQRSHADEATWEPLPLHLQRLSLPLPMMGVGPNTPTYQERHYYNHLPLPHNHCDGRYGYLPSSPRDTMDIGSQDPELIVIARQRPKEQSCLVGCCNPTLEEPNDCHSKEMDDDDFMLEKPSGFLSLHHELDSGLGWTDGSLHQGDLSGMETEEGGIEDYKSHGTLLPGSCRGFGGGGSPSSESYISSELSDSGFYSVSTGEFRHFQRLLEKRMRLYNARIQHQGEPCERRERRDSCPKSHRELLESIPEALTTQPPYQSRQVAMEEGVLEPPTRGLFRVSSVQFHKVERPCLNRHSSSSGALFNPCHAAVSRMTAPVLSTCSTPSSHRKPFIPMQAQGYNSVSMLRRSRTLHHRPPPQEYRRRASHPASPSYCAATLHHCGAVSPCRVHQFARGLPEEGELMLGAMPSNAAGLAQSVHQHPVTPFTGHIPCERCHEDNPCNQEAHHDWWHLQERCLMPEPMAAERDREIERNLEQRNILKKEELEREAAIQEEINREEQNEQLRNGAREQQQFQNLAQSFQMGDINDTWPKPASRQSQAGVTGRGPYSTLEGHTGACTAVGSHPRSDLFDPDTKPISTSRFSRSQLLRDRASQLANERSGMSTDEETNSDMLMGRYWTRTERKEQFLLAREQKQQQQQLQAKLAPARDAVSRGPSPADGEASFTENMGLVDNRAHGPLIGGRCNMALKLSRRKLSRLRNRKLLDDWITVEELLTHGTRLDNQEDTLCPSSLLTVTTV
ncbi:PDZ domain-containing RING finger protein 4 [Takifugu flavidus]|uniref:PDZ domain-containing RING finger protein 4 n=2 Tax=Takifugu flavidus TaxID=433684 RepID=A0A5C6N6K7_9TELE|nr:PDZ domain-containing RING finger protein 4 [Takifugu flavidus]